MKPLLATPRHVLRVTSSSLSSSSSSLAGRRTFSITMAQKLQEPVINKVSDLPIDEARWITLKKIEFTDQMGKDRTWEVATRKTRGKAGVDAVAMGNILLHPSRPASTMVVIQVRVAAPAPPELTNNH